MSEVDVSIDGAVAVVTIDRPEARNAIGLSTMSEFAHALDVVGAEAVNALVIRGAGERAFVSGGDLKELSAIKDEPGAIEMAVRMRRLLDRLATFPVPVIAALNGHALGGGAEVAVATDLRVAADDVQLGFTQVQLAIMPAWGGAERLAELVGRARALMLIATGTRLTAREAAEIGLVETVVPREEFDAAWRGLAASFAALPAGAGRAIKEVIAAAKPNHHQALEVGAVRNFARLWVGDAHWRAAEAAASARRKAAGEAPAPPACPSDGAAASSLVGGHDPAKARDL